MDDKDLRDFVKVVADAYQHIYDLAYLRNSKLLNLLLPDGQTNQSTNKERVWQFHHLLLDTIQELDPGPQVPAFSREWRRHRLLVLHYIDGLTPQEVADRLAISRRHFYREHDSAIDALANILASRLPTQSLLSESNSAAESAPAVTDRLQLIRLEAAQLAQTDRRINLADVLSGALVLLTDKLHQQHLTIDNRIDADSPHVLGDSRLLRQLLLGLLAHLINEAHNGQLSLTTEKADSEYLRLRLSLSSETCLNQLVEQGSNALSAFEELATLTTARLEPVLTGEDITGFILTLDLFVERRVVLIIDDNEDTLELFRRYLMPRHYDVITVRKPSDLLDAAKRVHPSVIILDLMIPDQDGWDLLQILQHQPETQSVPVIICSVLRQKELALSLGATAFLEKPVSEEALGSLLALLIWSL